MKRHKSPKVAIGMSPLPRSGSTFSDSDPNNLAMPPRGLIGPASSPNLGGGEMPSGVL